MKKYKDQFSLKDKVYIITGGGGLIGMKHAEAVMEGEGIPVLLDIVDAGMQRVKNTLKEEYGEDTKVETFVVDITKKEALEAVRDELLKKYGHIDGLINNAANNPKVEGGSKNLGATRFPGFPVDIWNADLAVGLTGAMLCAQVFGQVMEKQESGVIEAVVEDVPTITPQEKKMLPEGKQS